MEYISKTVSELRAGFEAGANSTLQARLKNLRDFSTMITENEPEIAQSLFKDLGKSEGEAFLTETLLIKNACADAIYNLAHWMKVERAEMGRMALLPDMTGTIEKVPLGVVMVIGAWNYPLQLTLIPVIGALAGGNTVVVKPSEVAVNSSLLIARMIKKYMDPRVCQVIEGGVPETTEILAQPLDMIFFTGSTVVGKIVYKAAAEKMIPVVLELGGKSPTIIDTTTNLEQAADRIMWGKTLNSGQTCIAPDYVMAIGLSDAQVDQFANFCKKSLLKIFNSESLQDCPSYTRIINANHHQRISKLVAGQKQVPGSKVVQMGVENVVTKFFPPTIITGLTHKSHSDPIMSQELFGPVLPVVKVSGVSQALAFHSKVGPTPLALYIFSTDPLTISALKAGINAGGVVLNDTMMHCAIEGLPFGGVGTSGSGVYHGPHNFTTFTRRQAHMSRSTLTDLGSLLRYSRILQGTVLGAVKGLMTVGVPSDTYLKAVGLVDSVGGLEMIKLVLVFLMGVVVSRSL